MTDRQADVLLAELAPHSPWRRSRKGNLWRKYGSLTLTVFPDTYAPPGRASPGALG